jgi:hypothetical protein
MKYTMDIKKYDAAYSNALNIFNPYKVFPYRISRKIPIYDIQAYKLNPSYRFVYDKLFIVQSQYIKGGELKDVPNDVEYPIFIKPRWGHKTSTSKDCYKIKSRDELTPHLHKKDMMWSEFIDDREGMTDFILVNGEIVFQITYVYSEKQHGFADVWKHVSSDNKPPPEIVDWVSKHMVGYTGPLNVQYRSTKIIEVGMRFARSGMYIESTNHKVLIEAINHLAETKTWICRETIVIEPFYSFKCWSPIPVFCLISQHIIDLIMKFGHSMPFYEYYFEPTGSHSIVFFQFLHKNFEEGMMLKELLERIMMVINSTFILLCIYAVVCFSMGKQCKLVYYVIVGMIISSLINSLDVIQNQITHQKQFIF